MKPTVVFQTDFGAGGGGVLAGVVKCIDQEVPVYDFTHEIAPFDIRDASYQLSSIVGYWPSGTVFVSVVDPGVGTSRRSCVARLASGSYVVTPDNGTLTALLDQIVEVREIDERLNRLPGSENVHIFNGRDVYAYTAGRLASGVISYGQVGPAYPLDEIVLLPLTNVQPSLGAGWAEGGIYNFDKPYGSCRINIRNRDFQQVAGFAYGDHFTVHITCGDQTIYGGRGIYERTFGFNDGSEAFLCGDIQPGEGQLLRFNVGDNFIKQFAAWLDDDSTQPYDYKVRFEKA